MKTRLLLRKQINDCQYEPFTGEIEIMVECVDMDEISEKYKELEETLDSLIVDRIESLKQ